jgi:LacI family transcriptional regulator
MPRQKDNTSRVLVVMPLANYLNRRLLNGFLEYARANGPWQVNIVPDEDPASTHAAVRDWHPHAAVVLQEEGGCALDFAALGVPSVIINPSACAKPPTSGACVFLRRDYEQIGRTAAKHFLDRNYVNFAFAGGTRNIGRVREMAEGFEAAVRGANRTFIAYPPPSPREGRNFGLEEPRLVAWLASLPKPTAIFTPHDMRAKQVLNACLAAGIRVPEDVGVLGMGNDKALCELSTPSISSVDIYCERAGRLAAQLADDLLRGRPVPAGKAITFASAVTRHSTDSRLIDDPLVIRALECIDRNLANSAYGIDMLAKDLHVSRRTLELRIRRTLGRSLGMEIAALRLSRAAVLLLDTDLPVAEIAERAGFCDASYFVLRFKRHYGVTPAAWRRRPVPRA